MHSPYKEKFAVPRQPNLVQDGTGKLELLPPFDVIDAVRGLEAFSHLWLIFQFHHIQTGKWQPTVRPPRLGGNQRVGVFASRSTHRPNSLGLSKVALTGIVQKQGKILLELGSVDLVDGTPIFDIKPYLAYADSEPLAKSGFAQEKPLGKLKVVFSPKAHQQAQKIEKTLPHFRRFIKEVLEQDPRPAYQKRQGNHRIYGVKLYHFNVKWQVSSLPNAPIFDEILQVLDITPF